MDVLKKVFNSISYLQYPIMISSFFFALRPYFTGFETLFADVNNMLIIMGLGISFSTLQDTKKTQNEVSRKIWSNPKKSKWWISIMLIFCLIIMLAGVFSYFKSAESKLKDVSIGLIVFGISMLGMVKAALEMAEYQQKINSEK